ncbi:glutaredoxin-like protein [Cardiobacterium valvarum F0432]|uniref:Glutaredoxin-like protein n=2 Tax=Cardiobacterium valvarum TaxID=194702 RepID=G9ZDQ6_9GAMM|nr:glutaredoxin-like protein [Cardiobacterium valvarum F0432]
MRISHSPLYNVRLFFPVIFMSYLLYIRLGCHLCADAAALLAAADVPAQRVNIDRDPALRAQYDTLVPVLYDPARDRELIYPFDATDIARFCAASAEPD